RDPFRHPVESLTFWGLKPGMTIIEVDPGVAGYWNEILTAYATATGGRYIAASAPYFAGGRSVEALSLTSPPIAPPGTADFVLTARNIHNMMWEPGLLAKALKDFHDVLKPNGILAIEEHRADPKPQVDTGSRPASNGYVAVANVVAAARQAGFRLDGQSEVNANPKDSKDHPFGVWTLPPTRQSSARGQPTPPDFDRARYDGIGESDRMTLRFRKI
ncbi:MAG TPA: methyltransferase, partial [Phenylobacterium sp.]|nr:methyltransferase [Phenylobacterium sp.]